MRVSAGEFALRYFWMRCPYRLSMKSWYDGMQPVSAMPPAISCVSRLVS